MAEDSKMTFYRLLTHPDICKIKIPLIQRDYAQGRASAKAVREKLIDNFKQALTDESASPVMLDCVYGSIDANKSFIPIDGQQRLTTLYLLHWYIAMTSDNLAHQEENLLKFTYEIRDSAKEFCDALVRRSFVIGSEEISKDIKNQSWYHAGTFNSDPTIMGMLEMLDEIHRKFKGEYSAKIYTILFSEGAPIWFLWLNIENLGNQTDDLYIKINARGKGLTQFELFKATVQKKLAATDRTKAFINNLDNDWLELFRKQFSLEGLDEDRSPAIAENEMFRFILFVAYIFYKQYCEDDKAPRDSGLIWDYNPPVEDINFDFTYAVEAVCDEKRLSSLMDIMGNLENLHKSEAFEDVKDTFNNILNGRSTDLASVSKLYAVISYNTIIGVDGYKDFRRILNNMLSGYREFQKARTAYGSFHDARQVKEFFNAIDTLVSSIKKVAILEAVSISDISVRGFEQEKLKANYIRLNPDEYEKIVKLEEITALNGLIHNVFFEDKIWLSPEQVTDILKNKRKFLQLLQTYHKETPFARVSTSWTEGRVDFLRYWFKSEGYGDYILTYDIKNDGSGFQNALKECVREIGNTCKLVRDLLSERQRSVSFDSVWDYVAVYEEFFSDDESSCCKMPFDAPYHIIICERANNSKGGQWDKELHNPFCKALARKLGIDNAKFEGELKEKLIIDERRSIAILSEGGWLLFDGNNKKLIKHEKGKDCIEEACSFLC